MDAVGSERAALFGYSEGGSMSSLFAAAHPEHAQALIICGGYARKLNAEDYPWGISYEEINASIEEYPCNWGVYNYTYLVFSLIWGAIFFAEFPAWVSLSGIVVIVIAGIPVLPKKVIAKQPF